MLAPMALDQDYDDDQVVTALKDALASGHSHKDAVVHVTAISGRAKKDVYRIALTLKDADSTTPSPLTRKDFKPRKVRAERWGRWAEVWVAFCLFIRGYRILYHSYRCPHGEIDLITKRGNCIVFIEVKFRSRFDDYDQVLPAYHASKKAMACFAILYENTR